MPYQRNALFLSLFLFMILSVVMATTPRPATGQDGGSQKGAPQTQGESQRKPRAQIVKRPTVAEIEAEFPSVDRDEPDEPDAAKRAKRQAKNSRFDGKRMVQDDPYRSSTGSVLINDWEVGLPALPAAQSKVVVIGEVTDVQAHMSNDRNGVYSEFAVRVEEVLKNSTDIELAAGSAIVLEREGGIVKHAPNQSRLYRIEGQGFPRKGRRYVFFLNPVGQEPDYEIVAGYELRGSKVVLLDTVSQFRKYEGVDEATFLNAVREAIAN
jgi:hypothetical protein